MNIFMNSINKILKGAIKAFETFPAVIGNALAFAIVTMIRIQLEWNQQEPYNFLFNCLHWGFAFGAIFSLAAVTFAQSRYDTKKSFLLANLLGVAVAGVTILVLYLFGESDYNLYESQYQVISSLAAARVMALMAISYLVFIVLGGTPRENKVESDFSQSFFMSHKAFFIALIYGGVIMAGSSGVARAVEALLYNDMSYKVYMYIGTIVGFVAFTIFVGYFPSFRKGIMDPQRGIAQKQPRFIEILFGYIMVPILMALTVVLLLWTGRTILSGIDVSFVLLSGIATAYTAYGLWLYVMVTHHDTGLAKFYRRVYPFAALVILAFEAWALYTQLSKTGLKLTEYWFAVVWIIAVASAVLLILFQKKAYHIIVAILCAFLLIVVQPVIGYHALPVSAQTDRLETLLVTQGMLVEDKIVAADKEPELEVRENITDAVEYLIYANDAKLPAWLDRNLSDSNKFEKQFGFEKVWPRQDNPLNPGGQYMNMNLNLPSGVVDVSGYDWAISMPVEYLKVNTPVSLETENGTYEFLWRMEQPSGLPYVKVSLEDRILMENDMKDYVDRLTKKFPPGEQRTYSPTLEDMSLKLESPELEVMLVFRYIDVTLDLRQDTINYWLELDAMYIKEK